MPYSSKMTRLLTKKRGIAYILGALLALPIITAIYFVVDFADVGFQRMQIQQALDAAAIAAARYDIADAQSHAELIFNANLENTLNPKLSSVSLDVASDPSYVTLTATHSHSGILQNITGNAWEIKDTLTLNRVAGGLEFVLVLNRVSGSNLKDEVGSLFEFFDRNKTLDHTYSGIVPCCSIDDALYLTDAQSTIASFLGSLPDQDHANFSGIDIAHTYLLDPGTTHGPPTPKDYGVAQNLKFILLVTDNPTIDANFSTHCSAAKDHGIQIGIISVGTMLPIETVEAYEQCVSHSTLYRNVAAAGDVPSALEKLKLSILPIYVNT